MSMQTIGVIIRITSDFNVMNTYITTASLSLPLLLIILFIAYILQALTSTLFICWLQLLYKDMVAFLMITGN